MNGDLVLRGLSLTYDTQPAPAVDRIDLELPAGSCLAMLGPSGSGKSTMLRMIAGLLAPDAGDILLGGRSLLSEPPERRGISLLSQRPLLFPHLSTLDNIAFPLRVQSSNRRAARLAAERYLHLVQLDGYGTRPVHQLSGGQAQRVALARALAAEPEVLLLDEPFSALDLPLRTEMHELILQLRATLAPTVLIVTHDQQEAALLADSVALLHEGRLLQHGSVEELYHQPNSVLVHQLMGGHNLIPGIVVAGEHRSALGTVHLSEPPDDGPAVLLIRPESIQFTLSDDGEAVAKLERARPHGVRQLLTAQLADGTSLTAEAPLGHGLRLGASLRVDMNMRHAHAIATPAGHADQPANAHSNAPPLAGLTQSQRGDIFPKPEAEAPTPRGSQS